jgi:LPS export ABC transporter permease LptF/LPS export ABC transporter permease LptG
MRIFTRYILREVTSYALLGGVLFTFVLFMRDLDKILDLLVRDSASLADALRIFADMLPNTLTVTIPTAVLAGILLGLSRLAADSEVTAMRACGIGAFRFVRIVSILSFIALAVGLVNALYFAPQGAADLLRLEDRLKSSQASFEIQPRVFYEDFKNYVLYVQDVRSGAGAPTWRHVFLADLTQPANPNVTTAEEADISSSGTGDQQGLTLHLFNGGQHQISPNDPSELNYDISTFTSAPVPLQLATQDETHISRSNTRLQALPFRELWQRTHGLDLANHPIPTADIRSARIELNSRFSYPFACLVLMLIGVPLGLSSKRGGKSTGFVLTLLLVFGYYLLSNVGVAFAKSGKLTPFLGVWAANLIFAAFGLILLQQLAGGGVLLNFFHAVGATLGRKLVAIAPSNITAALTRLTSPAGDTADPAADSKTSTSPDPAGPYSAYAHHPAHPSPTLVQRMRSLFKTSFPLLLDEYVMRSYAENFILSLGAFVLLYVIFTFFELMGDIIRNQTPFVIVGEYLFNLIPYIVSAVTPLCSLLAVLITFGALNRASELTAMKATGISLYRVVVPVIVLAAILASALFAFDEYYLPGANRRQEQLRAQIKDKPAQTFVLAGRKWISGQTDKAGEPERIFYYTAYDPDRRVFADLSVFEFDPQTFTLQRRIFAKSTRWDPAVNAWVFDNGWERRFAGTAAGHQCDTRAVCYQPFSVATFPEIREQPAYFTKEDKPSDEMSYSELSDYIADLRQSGFDTIKLSVQLENKLAVPAITLVMAILAVPFAVSMGKRGGLVGIAAAIGVAIAYSVIALFFSAMGNINTLPPILAAWSPDLLFAIAGTYLLLRTPT